MSEEFIVIGVHESSDFSEIRTTFSLEKYSVFSGGRRHYELVKSFLPSNHCWIEIQGNIQEVFNQYAAIATPIVVFASGDPLFYGFANTIKKYRPSAKVKTFPTFNSLQLLCHAASIDYSELYAASVHGRTWGKLDEALIRGYKLIGVLTDKEKSPAAIARRMKEYNFNNYRIVIGEALGSKQEKVIELSIEEASKGDYNNLNCVLLIQLSKSTEVFGIPDDLFEGLDNRPNMITKMPIRLITLSQLNLSYAQCLWDIGFCTGSVSIEAKLQFTHLNIIAFEKRLECDQIFEENTRRFSAPGIKKVMGDFFEIDLTRYPTPDSVFIGGHGNNLEKMVKRVDKVLVPGGRIVMNVVKEESRATFVKTVKDLSYDLLSPIAITVDAHNPITILTAEKRIIGR